MENGIPGPFKKRCGDFFCLAIIFLSHGSSVPEVGNSMAMNQRKRGSQKTDSSSQGQISLIEGQHEFVAMPLGMAHKWRNFMKEENKK
jgi:hypothetical protein